MRIPYGVKCNINGKLCKVTRVDVECQQVYLKKDDGHGGTYSIARGDVIKPYLRPMGSMTEEEKCQFRDFVDWDYDCNWKANTLEELLNGNRIISRYVFELFDWLNACHFDYRGLIPMGLALEAPEGMYIN
jgi:hypothetical protein